MVVGFYLHEFGCCCSAQWIALEVIEEAVNVDFSAVKPLSSVLVSHEFDIVSVPDLLFIT